MNFATRAAQLALPVYWQDPDVLMFDCLQQMLLSPDACVLLSVALAAGRSQKLLHCGVTMCTATRYVYCNMLSLWCVQCKSLCTAVQLSVLQYHTCSAARYLSEFLQCRGFAGAFALLCYYVAPLTTLVKIIKARDSSTLNPLYCIMMFCNMALWLCYGLVSTHCSLVSHQHVLVLLVPHQHVLVSLVPHQHVLVSLVSHQHVLVSLVSHRMR